MSQTDFAQACAISRQAWNNAETGDNRLGLDAAMNVWRRTGVSLDYIYLGERTLLPFAIAREIEAIEQIERQRAPRSARGT